MVNRKIKEFASLKHHSKNDLFKELCFCILAANYSSEKTLKIQQNIGECFLLYSQEELSQKLRAVGYRFPNIRAKYITESRKYKEKLMRALTTFESKELREWIVQNIKGIGYKEASHFLRNIGFTDFAVIDFHIIDILVRNNIIEKPKTLTRTKYLEIEQVLRTISKKTHLNLAELDLYLWYMETGTIIK
jgi:N-glycosylase/DNA lyase